MNRSIQEHGAFGVIKQDPTGFRKVFTRGNRKGLEAEFYYFVLDII